MVLDPHSTHRGGTYPIYPNQVIQISLWICILNVTINKYIVLRRLKQK